MTSFIVFDAMCFIVVFFLVQLVVYRIIKATGDTFPGEPRTIAVRGIALAASLKLCWLYGVGYYELTHPGQQFPLGVRFIYTFTWSALSIAALVGWLASKPVQVKPSKPLLNIVLLLALPLLLHAQVTQLGTASDPCSGGTAFLLPSRPTPALPSVRYDPVGFACIVQGGAGQGIYQVDLDFVEPTIYTAGGRMMNVFVNDQPVLANFDPAKCGATSSSVKIRRSLLLASDSAGRFTIRLQNLIRNAMLASITLTPVSLVVPSSGIVMPALQTMEVDPVIGSDGKASFVVDFDPSVYDLNILMHVEVLGRTPVRAAFDYNLSAGPYAATRATVTLDSNTNLNLMSGSAWAAGTVVLLRWSRLAYPNQSTAPLLIH